MVAKASADQQGHALVVFRAVQHVASIGESRMSPNWRLLLLRRGFGAGVLLPSVSVASDLADPGF